MSRFRPVRSMLLAGGICLILVLGALQAQAQSSYPPDYGSQASYPDDAQASPGRVARLAYLSGQVNFAPAGENQWGSVEINRPMVLGDRLLTGSDGRAVLELGDASVRIAHDSAFDFLNLGDNNVQIELSQGTLNLAVHRLAQGDNFEVDTPTLAFVASTPGNYRIDNDPDGTGSMVTVFRGAGTVYGENGASRNVTAGNSYRFDDSSLARVDVQGVPEPDDFDRFCEARDGSYARYAQQQQEYIPPEMIGGADLYEYGSWDAVPDYGRVWYPRTVPAGWAPYRYGHWAWIDPWGWTWVDDQPWGFAPFHYGRWVYVSNRWGWIPGPVNVRPVYAPALVAFVGGSGLSVSVRIGGGGPVGWFPLGPRDVYVPWFHASRHYFNRVNVTNIRNVYVNQTIINNYYNDYRHDRFDRSRYRDHYAYRRMPGAVTVVPRNVFASARPVHPAVMRINREQLSRADLSMRPKVVPDKASLGLRHPETRVIDVKGRRPFVRPVVARHEPAPRPVSFSEREKIIASQHGRPVTPAQLRQLRSHERPTATQEERVRLVPRVTEARGEQAPNRGKPTEPFRNTIHPVPVRGDAKSPPTRDTVRPIPAKRQPPELERQPARLPSSRFAHPEQPRTLPRAPVLQPATEAPARREGSGRLPVATPVRPALQPDHEAGRRADENRMREQQAERQRAVQRQTQQRAREQQAERQLQLQTQAREQQAARQRQLQSQERARAEQQAAQQRQLQSQERAREQQMQRQREVQAQAQERAREQQAARQRQLQQQSQERVREQQMQRQREMQIQAQQRVRAQQAQQAQMMPRETRQPPPRYVPPQRQQEQPQRRAPEPRKHKDDDGNGARIRR